MILILDNYDSFTFNLVQAIGALGHEPVVRRNDEGDLNSLLQLDPRALVVSPGPGGPPDAGLSRDAIRAFHGRVPILGVCLGHQCLASAFGGQVVRSKRPLHGVATAVHHDETGLFCGVTSPFLAARYHSLAIDEATLPTNFRINAWSEDGIPMSLTDDAAEAFGLQFHPESFLTDQGPLLLSNFLRHVC